MLGGVDDRKPGPAVAQEVLVERALDAGVLGDRDRVGVHDVGDADPLDPARELGLDRVAARRLAEDEADQREPDAGDRVAADRRATTPRRDEQVGEAAAERGREAGRPGAVAGEPPGDRARDPPAVEREGGDQVEDEDEDVDARPARRPSPAARRCRRCRSTRIASQNSSAPATAIPTAHAGDGDQRSVTAGPAAAILNSWPGRVGVLAHPRDAAEQPQGDLGDRDPEAVGDERVAELVQQDRAEEGERRGDREQVRVGARTGSAPSTSR